MVLVVLLVKHTAVSFIDNYHTIDLYQPSKMARGRADIGLAAG